MTDTHSITIDAPAGAGTPSAAERFMQVRRRQTRRRVAIVWVGRLTLAVVLLLAWQFVSGRLIDSYLISDPVAVGRRLVTWLADGTLLDNGLVTLREALVGFAIGAAGGVVVGYASGVSKLWADILEPFVSAAYSIPRIALIPLMIVLVGVGAELATTMAAIIVFFLIFFNTFHGVREVDKKLIDATLIMGGSRTDLALRVRFPSALVWIVAGLKIAIPQAFVGVVGAEIIASDSGLGYLVSRHAAVFDMAGAYAALIALVVIGFLLDRVVTLLSRTALSWKGTHA